MNGIVRVIIYFSPIFEPYNRFNKGVLNIRIDIEKRNPVNNVIIKNFIKREYEC